MRFVVELQNTDQSRIAFDGKYKIHESGALIVTPEGDREAVTYAPSFWASVTHAKRESSGKAMFV